MLRIGWGLTNVSVAWSDVSPEGKDGPPIVSVCGSCKHDGGSTPSTETSHVHVASFHNAPAKSHLALKKPKKKTVLTKRKAGSCTGQVAVHVDVNMLGASAGPGMLAMQQECELHLLPVYGTKKVLAKRLKQHFRDHKHGSSKRAKPQDISTFFASFQTTKPTKKTSKTSSSSSSSTT